MIKEIMEVLPLIKNKIANDKQIKSYLNKGREKPLNDISEQVMYKTTLDIGELNEINFAQSLITLSLLTINGGSTKYEAILKIGIGISDKINSKDGIPLQLLILKRVIELVEGSRFGLPNRPEFAVADEAYFDEDRNIVGYVALFTLYNGKNENEF